MYYRVKLLNDAVDNSIAEIIPSQNGDTVSLYVSSGNRKMKAHLDNILSRDAYVLSPGNNSSNVFSDSVFHVYPNTVYYMQALPEILAWNGYYVTIHNEVHKSIDFMDESWYTLKSADQGIYYNDKGERIVKYVPSGHIAMHQDGRAVAGGKYLNANIDKEGAEWTLVENPYEDASDEERQAAQQYMDMSLQDYHPGVEQELYKRRESEDDEFYQVERDFDAQGRKLNEHFDEKPAPESKKEKLSPGKILYSPDTGYALRSENWPPEVPEYDKYQWYVFDDNGLSDDEKAMYASLTGEHPMLLTGLDKGLVEGPVSLPTDDGFLFSTPTTAESEIEINLRDRAPYDLSEMSTPEYRKAAERAHKALTKIKGLTQERDPETGEMRISKSLENIDIPELQGEIASFRVDPYNYQKAGILALVEESQYEAFGGPKGWHGHFLNYLYGLGKTAIVAGANAVLRNRGRIEDGKQTTIVTSPNKNVYVWQGEVGKFLGEHAEVIDGDRASRIEQWEELLKKAREEQLPSFIVVGSSKFRYTKNEDEEPDSDERWELDIDAKYMRLLALGGKTDTGHVGGSHIGAFVIDESGQYVNPDAARHSALQEIVESVYQSSGVTWTLNGDISGNSATDTISEVSFINAIARDNYLDLAMQYTKTNRDVKRESKQMNRRIWKDYQRLNEFMLTYGDQIYPLDGRTVAGKNFGFQRTEDLTAPLGKVWGKVYEQAASKMMRGAEVNQMQRTLGLMSIMIGASYGAVAPARMLEYDLSVNDIMEAASGRLIPSEYQVFRDEIKEFYRAATENKHSLSLGRLPKGDMDVADRDKVYKATISEANRELLDNIIANWDAPVLTQVMDQIDDEIMSNQIAGQSLRMGVAGFSKIAINNLYRKLREKYSDDKYLIQIVDGDTPASEVDAIQTRHQKEKDKIVISLVTGAGLYGLSLPADRSWRFPTWNSAKAGQYEGRFHRKAEQQNTTTVVVPDGIAQYMREIEGEKSRMAREATGALIEADDSEGELKVSEVGQMMSFLNRLSQYKPRILESDENDE